MLLKAEMAGGKCTRSKEKSDTPELSSELSAGGKQCLYIVPLQDELETHSAFKCILYLMNFVGICIVMT